jgi:hypothetical protein
METFTDTEVATIIDSVLLKGERSAAHASHAHTVLRVRYLLVHVERLALALAVSPIIDVTWAGARHGCVVDMLRAVVGDTLLLSQTLHVAVPAFPEGHLLHQPAPTAEMLHQRTELLHWLPHISSECYACFRDTVEAQQTSDIPVNSCKRVVDDLYSALRLADGIRWYAIPTAGPCDSTYQVRLYSTAELFQVLCKRYLAATRLLLAGQPLSHALLVKAVQLHMTAKRTTPVVVGDDASISNALVRRAWEVSSTVKGSLPYDLLLPVGNVGAVRDAMLQRKASAVVEKFVHKTVLNENNGLSHQEVALRKCAVVFNTYLAEDTTRLMLGVTQLSSAQGLHVEKSCTRALRAAN